MTTTSSTTRRAAIGPPPAAVRSPGARTWRVIGAVLALAAVGWGTINVVGLVAHEERTEVTAFDAGSVDVIDVGNEAGSVTVVGVDGAETVTVTANISEGLRDTGNRQEVVDTTLELRGTCPVLGGEWCDVHYTIEVPRDIDVVATSGDGSIDVSGIDGAVDLDADNGSIDVADVGGTLVADNDNGRISAADLRAPTVSAATDNGRIELSFAAPPVDVEARSRNGRVEVVVPDTPDAYRLEISTDNGDVENAVRTDPDSERSMTVTSRNGDVVARIGG